MYFKGTLSRLTLFQWVPFQPYLVYTIEERQGGNIFVIATRRGEEKLLQNILDSTELCKSVSIASVLIMSRKFLNQNIGSDNNDDNDDIQSRSESSSFS